MPVQQGERTPARQAITVGVAALLGLAAMVFLVTYVDNLTGRTSTTTIAPGQPVFPLGPAEDLAPVIAAEGPFLLQDAAGGQRDVFIQHLGDDDTAGWAAFSARADGTAADCSIEWQSESDQFVDGCSGAIFPADGEGLTRYPLTVDEDGILILRLEAQP